MRTILCLFSACSSTIIVIFYTNFMRAYIVLQETSTQHYPSLTDHHHQDCLVPGAPSWNTIHYQYTSLCYTYTTGFNIFLLLFRNSNFSSMKCRPDFLPLFSIVRNKGSIIGLRHRSKTEPGPPWLIGKNKMKINVGLAGTGGDTSSQPGDI